MSDMSVAFRDDLNELLANLPPEQRDKLPKTPPFYGQIRCSSKGAAKFTFQFYATIECAFFSTPQFIKIVEELAVVGKKQVRSWHSHQPYTPVIFWPEDTNVVTMALWFVHTDGTVKVRGYKAKMAGMHLPDSHIQEYIKMGKTNGINIYTVGDKSDDE